MSLAIHLEIGHDASLRTKTTPESFTHDWEVFVRGCNGADIHHYIEKVVFHLHETFQKPRRVVKDPPFSLRTSGYGGFTLPIEIYLRNSQEPKKIWFQYDIVLPQSGPPIHNVQKEKYVFHNPADDFRSRLLKGGAISSSSGVNQEITSNSTKIDDRNQMTSKPRLSGSDVVKKHKMKLDEPITSDFVNLFGTPITKMSKSLESAKPKEPPKPVSKPETKVSSDKDKDKMDKSKSTKSSHKDRDKEKEKSKDRSSEGSEKKNKEEKKKSKDDKSKDRERSKDKSFKKEREKERERSPRLPSHSPSPKRSPKRSSSPPPAPPKVVPVKEKEYYKEEKKDKEKDEKREKKDDKKSKKEKRDHKDKEKHKDREKEKEHKEHKNKEIKSSKEVSSFKSKDVNSITIPPPSQQIVNKPEKKEKIKEKESPKESPKEDDRIDKNRSEKTEDKSQKHKHKKKDKKEKREERHTKNEKKTDKQSNLMNKFREMTKDPPVPVISSRESDKNNLFGSPKSEPPSTPDQEPHKVVNNVPFKDEDSSIESVRGSSREPSPVPKPPSRSPSPMEVEPAKKVEPEKVKAKEDSPKKKEKKEKKKDKKSDKDHEKKRKRKNETAAPSQEVDEPSEKILKEEENNNSDDESKVSSTEDINPIPKNECDMDMLRDLQHKIMSLKDNADLQKVVQLIAETGQYEVSAHTFDFDLCLLDKSTVKQLQDFFSTVS